MIKDKASGDQCPCQMDNAAFVFGWILFLKWLTHDSSVSPHLIPPQLRMTRFSASILFLLLLTPPLLSYPIYPPTSLKLAFYHPTFTFTSTFYRITHIFSFFIHFLANLFLILFSNSPHFSPAFPHSPFPASAQKPLLQIFFPASICISLFVYKPHSSLKKVS